MISKAKLKEHIDKFPGEEISIDEINRQVSFYRKAGEKDRNFQTGWILNFRRFT